ncbi:protein IQ-DOMAIN 2-like [Lolium rigidum]|uniref:protein IQ-DOMAIN 2-like n=1 Tax=Lolium rigidum TaxID=89674 RepID=UPI001F5D7853|nr:protein IQ-DOMAIN 2-like [Lolium rigidum]
MGKKPKWLGAVKKVFSPESKDEKLRRRFAATAGASASAPYQPDLTPSASLEAHASALPPADTDDFDYEPHVVPAPVPAPVPVPVAVIAEEQQRQEHQQHEHAAPATEALPVAAPEAAVVASSSFSEEIAATKIQTAFRGHLARRALRALKGLVRLKSLVEGHSVKRQATSTLRCMQTLSRVQSKIRTRRIKMSEENQALQRQLLLNQELESLRMGDQWNTSLQSKEQIEAGLVSKQEAAARRERALAYAFSHQWKSTSRSTNPMFVDPNNPHWGWSWLERWMAARPAAEGRNGTNEKESNTDRMSVNSTSLNLSEGGEITKVDSRLDSNPDKPLPTTPKPSCPAASRQSPATPSSSGASPALASKKTTTPKNGSCVPGGDDDAKSVFSVQSERPRRHSIGTSSVRDDASLSGSSPSSVPSYMVPTKSARAKTRLQSPVAKESTTETLEKGWSSVGSVKKRLSFPAGVAPSPPPRRRHSGPPKIPQATVGSNAE